MRLLLVLLLVFSGCGWLTGNDLIVRDARIVANTAAMTLAASQLTAELLYKAEQLLVVEKAVQEEGMTKAEVRRRVEEVRSRWGPVKQLFARARRAHAALAAALEGGSSPLVVAPLAAEFAALEAGIGIALDEARSRIGG